jgi:hypothetical protein
MPFELGIFFGAKRFGNELQKSKNALIFERTKYLYQQYISDLNGMDSKAHQNDPEMAIRKVRDWLSCASRRVSIPGAARIIEEYKEFQKMLPFMAYRLGMDTDDISFNDFCALVEEAISARL